MARRRASRRQDQAGRREQEQQRSGIEKITKSEIPPITPISMAAKFVQDWEADQRAAAQAQQEQEIAEREDWGTPRLGRRRTRPYPR